MAGAGELLAGSGAPGGTGHDVGGAGWCELPTAGAGNRSGEADEFGDDPEGDPVVVGAGSASCSVSGAPVSCSEAIPALFSPEISPVTSVELGELNMRTPMYSSPVGLRK